MCEISPELPFKQTGNAMTTEMIGYKLCLENGRLMAIGGCFRYFKGHESGDLKAREIVIHHLNYLGYKRP